LQVLGGKIPFDAVICTLCGRQVEELKTAQLGTQGAGAGASPKLQSKSERQYQFKHQSQRQPKRQSQRHAKRHVPVSHEEQSDRAFIVLFPGLSGRPQILRGQDGMGSCIC
jgi:hypothetical protein